MRFYIWADFNVNAGTTTTVNGQTIRTPTYDWKLIHAPENFYSAYTQNNTIIPDEIYGSPIEEDKAFAYNINMDKEMNRAGSLSFSIANSHPEYRNIFPLGTTIAVTTPSEIPETRDANVYAGSDQQQIYVIDKGVINVGTGYQVHNLSDDKYYVFKNVWTEYQDIGHVIWFGRILTIERSFNLEKTVTCEGALAFLNDIMVRPRKFFKMITGEEHGKPYKMPADILLDMCINEYSTVCSMKRQIKTVERTTISSEGRYTQTTDDLSTRENRRKNPITIIQEGQEESHIAFIGEKFDYIDPLNPQKITTFLFTDDKEYDPENPRNGIWEEYTKHTSNNSTILSTTYTEISDYVTTLDKLTEIANLDPAVGIWCECTDDVDFDLTLYIGYLPYRHNPSKILFAQNLTEFTDNGDGQDIYTAVIPLGANKIRLNETQASSWSQYMHRVEDRQGVWFYDTPISDTLTLNGSTGQYGYIEKTIDYSDIDDSQLLADQAEANLKAYAYRNGKSFSIGAVELSLLSENRGDGYNEFLLTDMINSDYDPNNFITIGDGIYFASDPHGETFNRYQFTCTSFKMDIDNPGATSYTFEVYDTNYVPIQPKLLTSYLDKKRAIAEGKIASDGTIYYANRQGTVVYKEDDNHVVEVNPDHEVHYVADGEGDVRSGMTSYDMAYGTTEIPSSETAGNGEII